MMKDTLSQEINCEKSKRDICTVDQSDFPFPQRGEVARLDHPVRTVASMGWYDFPVCEIFGTAPGQHRRASLPKKRRREPSTHPLAPPEKGNGGGRNPSRQNFHTGNFMSVSRSQLGAKRHALLRCICPHLIQRGHCGQGKGPLLRGYCRPALFRLCPHTRVFR